MNFLQPRMLDVGVDLCRLNTRVAQHFLNVSQVGAAGEKVRRETMPQ